MMAGINLYTRCMSKGVDIIVELLLLEWGFIFAASGKYK